MQPGDVWWCSSWPPHIECQYGGINHPNAYNPVKSYISKCRGGYNRYRARGQQWFSASLIICAAVWCNWKNYLEWHMYPVMLQWFSASTTTPCTNFFFAIISDALHRPLNFANITFHSPPQPHIPPNCEKLFNTMNENWPGRKHLCNFQLWKTYGFQFVWSFGVSPKARGVSLRFLNVYLAIKRER